jgi:hypothetical protein
MNEIEKPTEKKPNVNFYIDAFRNFTIDADELKSHLISANFNEENVNLLVQNEINRMALEVK